LRQKILFDIFLIFSKILPCDIFIQIHSSNIRGSGVRNILMIAAFTYIATIGSIFAEYKYEAQILIDKTSTVNPCLLEVSNEFGPEVIWDRHLVWYSKIIRGTEVTENDAMNALANITITLTVDTPVFAANPTIFNVYHDFLTNNHLFEYEPPMMDEIHRFIITLRFDNENNIVTIEQV
jgi:hypothetical protein